ncbi:MAG: CBS domain-containing protein [Spirochaetaceae bacterium]|jgi:CBS domain-containing protein|nr:CBS domain-containing protein [Spirochaetaceae bacterium]
MTSIPLINDDTPSFILELIFLLKVKDVMTKNLIMVPRNSSLKELQAIMKEKRITGVPIAENKRLYGIISMDDIIRALEGGYIDEPAENYMTKNLIVLEEDMPLSFAINYMDKYHYGRFPVLSLHKELVGIVTSRDIINQLLVNINQEMARLEANMVKKEEADTGIGSFERSFLCHRFDFENAGRASTEIKKKLKSMHLDRKLIRRVAVAAYELEINLVVHSQGGSLSVSIDNQWVTIVAADRGPGMKDPSQALKEGFSTANDWIRSLGFGAGMGLPNVKRVSDEFSLESKWEEGTKVTSRINIADKENQ